MNSKSGNSDRRPLLRNLLLAVVPRMCFGIFIFLRFNREDAINDMIIHILKRLKGHLIPTYYTSSVHKLNTYKCLYVVVSNP